MSDLRPSEDGVPARQSAEYVYRRVRGAILDGELPPGETMSQVALAEARINRRVRVAPISADDLEELYAVRVALEAQALRLSVPRMTSERIARLEGAIAEMAHYAEQRDVRRWLVPHADYHRQLTEPAGGRFTVLLSQLFDYAERYRRLHIGSGPSAWATPDHREILDAVKAGDEQLAAARLAGHLSRIAFEVAEILEPGRELDILSRVLADAGATPPVRVP
jgi:DNA-binding GntR family transcriptional regulator